MAYSFFTPLDHKMLPNIKKKTPDSFENVHPSKTNLSDNKEADSDVDGDSDDSKDINNDHGSISHSHNITVMKSNIKEKSYCKNPFDDNLSITSSSSVNKEADSDDSGDSDDSNNDHGSISRTNSSNIETNNRQRHLYNDECVSSDEDFEYDPVRPALHESIENMSLETRRSYLRSNSYNIHQLFDPSLTNIASPKPTVEEFIGDVKRIYISFDCPVLKKMPVIVVKFPVEKIGEMFDLHTNQDGRPPFLEGVAPLLTK